MRMIGNLHFHKECEQKNGENEYTYVFITVAKPTSLGFREKTEDSCKIEMETCFGDHFEACFYYNTYEKYMRCVNKLKGRMIVSWMIMIVMEVGTDNITGPITCFDFYPFDSFDPKTGSLEIPKTFGEYQIVAGPLEEFFCRGDAFFFRVKQSQYHVYKRYIEVTKDAMKIATRTLLKTPNVCDAEWCQKCVKGKIIVGVLNKNGIEKSLGAPTPSHFVILEPTFCNLKSFLL